jgi:hypothetical protein
MKVTKVKLTAISHFGKNRSQKTNTFVELENIFGINMYR